MRYDTTSEPARVVIELWADLGCPWCYLGRHRLRRAIQARPDAERFEVKIRSFELHPEFAREPETIESALTRTYGDASVVMQAERQFQALARREGLAFELDRLSANTLGLHRVMHYAEESGRGLRLFARLQDRFFAGEINPFDAETLASVAESLGLSAERVRQVLVGDEYAAAVRADIREGMALGARGVPFVVFDRRTAVSGTRSSAEYARALDEAITALPRKATS